VVQLAMVTLNRLFRLVLLTLVIVSLAIVLKMTDIPHIKIEPVISPTHALSIVVTAAFAIGISLLFEPSRSKNSSEKTLKIERLKTLIESIDKLQSEIADGRASLYYVNSFTKGIETKLRLILGTEPALNKELENLQKELRGLNNLLTSTPADPIKDADVKVVKGQYNYSTSRIAEINHSLESISNSIFSTQLKINAG